MAHRTLIDRLLGRHYCPSCGIAAGFRQEDSYDKTKVSWYQLAPTRQYCISCDIQVRGSIRPGIWVRLLLCVFISFCVLILADTIVGNTAINLMIIAISWFIALLIFQEFIYYERVENNAP